MTRPPKPRPASEESRWRSDALNLLANSVPALIAYFDARTLICEFANRGYAAAFGLPQDQIVGRHVEDIVGQEAMAEIMPHIETVKRTRSTTTYERRIGPQGAGTQASPGQWLEVHLLPHEDEGTGEVIGCFVMILDITRHRIAERIAIESQLRLSRFMQASTEGIVFHKNGIITDTNPSACVLSGYPRDMLVGRNLLEMVAPEVRGAAAAGMQSPEDAHTESVMVDRHGARIPVEVFARTLVTNGESHRMMVVRDLRGRQADQARIHHLAHHDPLTGLPNRMGFMRELDAGMQKASQDGRPLALLFIDLDKFKRVNDSLGHLAGDKLLQALADRLKAVLQPGDKVARFGGDEFMALLSDASDRAAVEDIATRLLVTIGMPVQADDWLISVTPSIGIATYPGPASSAADLIKQADSAMYAAKAKGRANFQFYDPRGQESAYRALVLESELAQALDEDQFVLHYQPKVDEQDQVVGVEALLRWQHPRRGLLTPDQFIDVAEEQRLMLRLGLWVLRAAARQAREWQAEGLSLGKIGVNLSAGQFRWIEFVASLERLLLEETVDPVLLEFELNERTLVDDMPEVHDRLARLKALGLDICVDHFGTGHFSLRHLKELPLDCVKIDKSFVSDLPHDEDSAAIVRAIVKMAHALRRGVVAEGVETDGARRFLAALGCQRFQGTSICPPLTAAELSDWVRTRRRPP